MFEIRRNSALWEDSVRDISAREAARRRVVKTSCLLRVRPISVPTTTYFLLLPISGLHNGNSHSPHVTLLKRHVKRKCELIS